MRLLSYISYIDPGTGSIVFQSLVGVIAGIGLFGRRAISGVGHKIKSLFSRSGPKSSRRS